MTKNVMHCRGISQTNAFFKRLSDHPRGSCNRSMLNGPSWRRRLGRPIARTRVKPTRNGNGSNARRRMLENVDVTTRCVLVSFRARRALFITPTTIPDANSAHHSSGVNLNSFTLGLAGDKVNVFVPDAFPFLLPLGLFSNSSRGGGDDGGVLLSTTGSAYSFLFSLPGDLKSAFVSPGLAVEESPLWSALECGNRETEGAFRSSWSSLSLPVSVSPPEDSGALSFVPFLSRLRVSPNAPRRSALRSSPISLTSPALRFHKLVSAASNPAQALSSAAVFWYAFALIAST